MHLKLLPHMRCAAHPVQLTLRPFSLYLLYLALHRLH